jgi:chromate transporter
MQRDLVERCRWVSKEDFVEGLAFAQLCPGPLAAQLAMYLGWLRAGALGAILVSLVFVGPSFLMVLALAGLYVHYGGLWWVQGAFYGIGAAVIAILARSAFKLARLTLGRDWLLWIIFAVAAAVTALTASELVWVFVLGGVVTLLWRAPPRFFNRSRPDQLAAGLTWFISGLHGPADKSTLWTLLWYFTEAGAFVFGSGLAILPFLHQGVVQQFGWLNEHQFLDAVAVAMITPGPVVITVAFIGYLVAGLAGAVMASIGIFLPVYVFTVVPAPWFKRHRNNPQLKAFVDGATAAATGAITGAVIVLGARAITDLPTAAIALISLGVLWRYKISEPIIVTVSGLIGLILWPLVRGG